MVLIQVNHEGCKKSEKDHRLTALGDRNSEKDLDDFFLEKMGPTPRLFMGGFGGFFLRYSRTAPKKC